MDLYLNKAKLVLFVDSLEARSVDLEKCTDLTALYIKEGGRAVVEKAANMVGGWIYLQRGIVDELTLKQVSYFCDGFVEYLLTNHNINQKWWFKTNSTKVIHSPTPAFKEVNENASKGGLELLEERHAREMDKVELSFGSGQAAIAGFDSDDPDADLDI